MSLSRRNNAKQYTMVPSLHINFLVKQFVTQSTRANMFSQSNITVLYPSCPDGNGSFNIEYYVEKAYETC
ncbi:hypothetical protein V2G26_007179 [Clonostachys chloroleuca]